MARLAMVVDTRRCVGCLDCVLACRTENGTAEGCHRDWVTQTLTGTFPTLSLLIRSERCNHCDDPPCVSCCPTGASHVHSWGGVVLVEKAQCVGCKACLASCPYGARSIDPDGRADKCTFCIHRVEAGQETACVAVCPARALNLGDLDDPASEVSRLVASRPGHVLLPEAGTRPRIVFLT